MPSPNGLPPAEDSSLATGKRNAFRFILLLGLLDALGPLGIDMYLPAFPTIEQELQAGGGSMQLTLALFLAGLAIGQLICGPISDRIGRKIPLLFGAFAFAVASVICAQATTIESLIAARFVMGLAGSVGMVVARAVVRDSFAERDSARVYSLLMLVIGIAPIISPSFGTWLLQLGSWHLIFWGLAAFSCLCGVAVAFDMPETHPIAKRSKVSFRTIAGQYLGMSCDFRFLAYALPASFGLGQIFAYVASAPSLFMDIYGLSPNAFTIAFASNAIGLIGIAQVNRWLARRMDTHQIFRAALLLNLAASVALLAVAGTGWGGFAVFQAMLFLCLMSLGLILPNATAAVMAPFPHQAGAASALLGMLQFAIGAGTGALVGIFDNGTSLPMVWTIAACSLLSVAVAMKAQWDRQRVRSTGSPECETTGKPCLTSD